MAYNLYVASGHTRSLVDTYPTKEEAAEDLRMSCDWTFFHVEFDMENDAADIAAAKHSQMDIYSIEPAN